MTKKSNTSGRLALKALENLQYSIWNIQRSATAWHKQTFNPKT